MSFMTRKSYAVAIAFAALVRASPALAQGSVRVVGGYTNRAFSDAYVKDATKAARNSFDRFLEKSAPRARFEAISFETTADLIQALKSKQIDMVGGSTNQIIEISRQVGIEPVFVAEGLSTFFHDGLLLVRKDSRIDGFKDLEGKALMALEGAEDGDLRLWLDTWALRESGRPAEAYFGSILRARNGLQTTLACFFSRADACVVPRGTYDEARKANPQVGLVLKELGSSTGLPAAVLAFRAGLDREAKAQVTDIVTHIQDDIFGQQVMKLFHQKRFVRIRPEHLSAAEALVKEHTELLKAYAAAPRQR